MKKKIRVGVVQLDVGPDKVKNIDKALALIEKGAKDGASVLALPELFNYMGSFDSPDEIAEEENGPTIGSMKEAAKKHKVYIVAGSVLIRQEEGLPKNTCFFISPEGKILSEYSKMHLFDLAVPEKISFLESKFMQAGEHVTTCETDFGKVGFAICNDLRYPEIFRAMTFDGAKIIFVPSAFTKFTGQHHWHSLTKVRAIENQIFIVAINQSGKNIEGVKFFGHSRVVDPMGKILVDGNEDGDQLLMCDIDLNELDTFREQLPALKKIKKEYKIKAK
ncbi:MAG: carbon-nitrogen hydrolase family protein [Pseudomonadota bacterium]